MSGLCQGQKPVLALPIFPGRRQPSIISRNELNYRVRNGNGWTLALISTNFYVIRPCRKTTVLYCLFPLLSSPFRFLRLLPQRKPAQRLRCGNEKAVKGASFAPLGAKRTIRSLSQGLPSKPSASGFDGKAKNCPPRLRSLAVQAGIRASRAILNW